jgi:hypothetical protein
MSEQQTMTDAELSDHIEFLKEAKEGIEKQFGGLAHGPWDAIPGIIADLGENHLLVREYRRVCQTLYDAKAEQGRRGSVV